MPTKPMLNETILYNLLNLYLFCFYFGEFIRRIISDGYYKYDEIQLSNVHNSNKTQSYSMFTLSYGI